MIHGDLSDLDAGISLFKGVAWDAALSWLRQQSPATGLGRHEILGSDVYATVMEYGTLDRSQARFESHREFVDLQCTLEGEEIIDWCPSHKLVADGAMEEDVQFWLPTETPYTPIFQAVRRFSVFFPTDAHRPKVRAMSDRARKVVIKVRLGLVI